MFDMKEYNKKYYAANKESMLKQSKEWRDNNLEHLREYWNRTREKTRERQRRWYEKHKKKIVEPKIIKTKAIIEVEPKVPLPRGRPKTGRMSETEKKQRKINRDLEEIQNKAEAYKLSLQSIDAEKSKSAPNSGGNE